MGTVSNEHLTKIYSNNCNLLPNIPFKIKNRTRCLAIATSVQHSAGGSSQYNKTENDKKHINIVIKEKRI